MSTAVTWMSFSEPVPSATQLATLPFLGAVAGYLRPHIAEEPEKLRVALHRVMSLNGSGYLQQVTRYIGFVQHSPTTAGRVFPVSQGIMGKAFKERRVFRTRHYDDPQQFISDLQQDMSETGDVRPASSVAKSYLAIPLLHEDLRVVAVFYAEAMQLNLFSNDKVLNDLLEICHGFCRSLDELVSVPIKGVRNYRLEEGAPFVTVDTVYTRIQEPFANGKVPSFKQIRSFNFDIST